MRSARYVPILLLMTGVLWIGPFQVDAAARPAQDAHRTLQDRSSDVSDIPDDQTSVSPSPQPPAPLRFQFLDSPLQPLQPMRPRTAGDLEQIEALAWYSVGYLRERRQDYMGAYQAYRQALRHAPHEGAIYQPLIRLAWALGRTDAAVHYALEAPEIEPENFPELVPLLNQLTREGNTAQALQLLEQLRDRSPIERHSPQYLVLMYQLGQLYEQQERYTDAAEALRAVADAIEHPERYDLTAPKLQEIFGGQPSRVYERLGEVLLEADRPDEARQAFQKAQEADPNDSRLSYHLAQVYLKTHRATDALAQLEPYLREQPPGAEAYRLLAVILEQLGRQKELVPKLEQAVENDPHNSSLKYYLAEQYLATENYEKAEKLYKELLSVAREPEGYQGLATVYRKTRRPEQLLDHLDQSWQADREWPQSLETELQAIASDEELTQAIIEQARQLKEDQATPLSIGAVYAAARIAGIAGQVDAAAEFYRLLIQEHPLVQWQTRWYYEWGLLYTQADRHADAAEVFQQAIDEQVVPPPMHPAFFHELLVRTLAPAGEVERALKVAKQAVQVHDNPQTQSLVAWVYYYARRWEDARDEYEKLLEEHLPIWHMGLGRPSRGQLNPLREAHFVLSYIYSQLDDLDTAEELLMRVLEDDPDDPHANNDLGYLWADHGKNLSQAEAMIRKAVEAEPNNVAYLDSLGWVLFKKEKYEEATEHLEMAVNKSEDGDPVIWDHLGDAYRQLNQLDKARQAWQKALEMFQKQTRTDPERTEAVRQKLELYSP